MPAGAKPKGYTTTITTSDGERDFVHRDERDQLFLNIASLFAQHSTCQRGHTGAVIAREGRIIATGYNGAPPGQPHCKDVGCGGAVERPLLGPHKEIVYDFPNGCTRAVHAEANAIAFAARYGISCDAAAMYCTHSPCNACAMLMASVGIYRVVFGDLYRVTEPIDKLRELGMVVDQVA
jgi:dCMP deaminase